MNNEENMTKGILGALLGSIIGIIVIILFGKLGFVASIAGFVMAGATIKLYEKFAGDISKKGIIVCIIIMIVMTIVGNNLTISILLVDELRENNIEATVFDIFIRFYTLLSNGYIDVSSYLTNLFMVLLFNVIGAFSFLRDKFNTLKKI